MSISRVLKTSLTFAPEIITKLKEPDPFVSSNRHILKINLRLDMNEVNDIREPDKDIDVALVALRTERSSHQVHATSIAEELDSGDSDPPITGIRRDGSRNPYGKAREELLVRRLCKIVAADRELHHEARIDAIELGPRPSRAYYLALGGLAPKHIVLSRGFEESLVVDPIESFFYPWDDIESAVIGDECHGWCMESFRAPKGETTAPGMNCAYPEFLSC
ncbi:hypothetical protein CPB83DRAFT_847075 [Crepidotus variabilis]|uniref:Uncharacterized protein n=1 Tax=Crepidotus variabilis TaxID=179855 RepID=A0A9P6EPN9_9AGAR|nr:hypothetical protein CPB83DRAFT_847075 [Crepidotus variabilis]